MERRDRLPFLTTENLEQLFQILQQETASFARRASTIVTFERDSSKSNTPVTPACLAARFILRLQLYCKMSGATIQTVAASLGLTPKTFEPLRRGLRLPSWQQLCTLSTLAQVDPMWWFEPYQEQDLCIATMVDLTWHMDKAQEKLRQLYREVKR